MRDIFKYVSNNDKKINGLFWKIHLSPLLEDFEYVLSVVDNLSVDMGLDYKFVERIEDQLFLSGISSPTTQTGKLITIYPTSEIQTAEIMSRLHGLLTNFDGIEVLSDRPYQDSKIIWYRYGTHLATANSDKEDERKNYFVLPDNVEDIFADDLQFNTGTYIQKKYNFSEILEESSGGNIYIASQSNQKFVVKEARKNVRYSLNVSKLSKRYEEFENAKKDHRGLVAEPVEIVEEPYSVFFVYRLIEGEALGVVSSSENFMMMTDFRQRDLRMKALAQKFITVIEGLMEEGFEEIDIQPNNFVISEDEEIVYIDTEVSDYLTNGESFTTEYFWLDKFSEDSLLIQNFRRTGMMFLFFLGDTNFFLYETRDFDQAFRLGLMRSLDYKFPLNFLNTAFYLLTSPSPNFEKVRDLLDSSTQGDNRIKQEISKMVGKQTDEIGLNGLSGQILLNEDVGEAIEIIQKRVFATEDGKKHISMVDEAKIISPYLSSGLAGVAYVFVNDTRLRESIDVSIFNDLLVPFSKSGDFSNGLLGIVYSNVLLYDALHDSKFIKAATDQMMNLFGLVSIIENKIGVFDFRHGVNTEDYEVLLEIYELLNKRRRTDDV
ncbi:MAG: hypothetical protein LBM27_02170 [Lactobacillaceae bacterium]|nr:hypothetical protein [Lactobacillaceae bacterium]